MDILARKNLDLVIVALLAILLVMYDMTLDFCLELFHMGFEVVHNLFEWLELGIEHVVEHLFHTERHTSQIITFYILWSLGLFCCWRLWKLLPRWHQWFKGIVLEAWARRKTQLQLYWLTLSLPHKVAMAVTALVVAYLASFFIL